MKLTDAENAADGIFFPALEQTMMGAVLINENDEVMFFNPAAEKLWGYKREEVIGNNIDMLIPAIINKTIIVTTNAIKVIPFSLVLLILFILKFHLSIYYCNYFKTICFKCQYNILFYFIIFYININHTYFKLIMKGKFKIENKNKEFKRRSRFNPKRNKSNFKYFTGCILIL